MVDDNTLRRARKDVEAAKKVWAEIINTRLGGVVEYAYIKGSAVKKWENPIDYVPVISDLDIHIKTRDSKPLFNPDRDGFIKSMETTRIYQERFESLNPGYLHIPRPQVVTMDELNPEWVPHDLSTIEIIHGAVPRGPEHDVDEIRAKDRARLIELEQVLYDIPIRVVDRIGLEYYRIIRQLCWRVSPTPFRLLSQTLDPHHVWNLNRTGAIRELTANDFDDVAQHYHDYFMAGWEAFESGFTDNDAMRKVIMNAYFVFEASLSHAKKQFNIL